MPQRHLQFEIRHLQFKIRHLQFEIPHQACNVTPDTCMCMKRDPSTPQNEDPSFTIIQIGIRRPVFQYSLEAWKTTYESLPNQSSPRLSYNDFFRFPLCAYHLHVFATDY